METKDWLDIVIIPVSLAIFAVLLPAIQNWQRRRIFTKLILRELSEVSPYLPKDNEKDNYNHWWQHSKKTFIHQKIFQQPNENRDFILALDPNVVYFVSQLWDSLDKKNDKQWLEFLSKITEFSSKYKPIFRNKKAYRCYQKKIVNANNEWIDLIKNYKNQVSK